MASIDKVKVGQTTYNVSPSATGTLNGYTSNDNGTPPAWTDVSTIASSDTNSSIFSKLTTMVKNVRWLYSKLGTEDFSITGSDTVSGSLSNLQSELDGKSPSSHTHSTSSLPVSNNQVNSANYVPTSALLYSMSQRAEVIQSIVSTAKDELNGPNKRYESKNLGTWSSTSDVNTFLSTYNHENGYDGISLGNYVTIQDGSYNAIWEIAGFDMECGQLAADGTIYDNGYGICLIPKIVVTTGKWNSPSADTTYGYYSSYMHNTLLPGIVNTLKNVLEDHIVNRNVLLGTSGGSAYQSDAYAWTTAYATLMPFGQMNGTFIQAYKCDYGEAAYKLPLFDHENYYTTNNFWVRNVNSSVNGSVYYIDTAGIGNFLEANATRGVRPMIYIR